MKKIVILGGGTGGVVVATRLSKYLHQEIISEKVKIFLVDKNKNHEFRPSYLWVATGNKKSRRYIKTT
ncbi:hypothetical protein HRbin19_01346 [bacterium HR19]|nr:hypothetical protein HRbin19_01346 [bacterium HR19]